MNQQISSSAGIRQIMNKLVEVNIPGKAAAANDGEHAESANGRSICDVAKGDGALRKLSYAELHNLGISRDEVAYVLSHDNPGTDPEPDPASRSAA